MADTTPTALAKQLLRILHEDADRLQRIDDYLHGEHDDPYMPANADAEYKLLARRAVTNVMGLLVGTPAQAMYVDGFRPGMVADEISKAKAVKEAASESLQTPEWVHWQGSRLDARQMPVHRSALAFGHSFTVTLKKKGKVRTVGLSPLLTSALFEDPANDDDPYALLTVRSWQDGDTAGKATLWDQNREYKVTFKDFGQDVKVTVDKGVAHGLKNECPGTRFACVIDLEGRTWGVVEPMISVQDRINQTIFDLLVAQTFGSFQVRTATGMAPPFQTEPEYAADGTTIIGHKLRLGDDGKPIPAAIDVNARRFLFAEDKDVKFDSLPGTALSGYIEAVDMAFRHFSALGQIPPHHLLGQIANLSAEALQAAETSLLRMIEEFKHSFGESWERVFRLAGELAGNTDSAEDFAGEVIWRDMEQKSLAQIADALGKLKENLDIPAQGLWPRVPQVSQTELAEWKALAEEADSEALLANAISRATAGSTPPGTPATAPADTAPAAPAAPATAA